MTTWVELNMRTIDMWFQEPAPDASTEFHEDSDVEATDPEESDSSDEDCGSKRHKTGAHKP
jgi:hypothetical protein